MKKTTTLLTEISIYIVFLLVALFSFTFDTGAQTVKVMPDGNYVSVKSANDSTGYKSTGKYFEDTKGNRYDVMISKNGKLFYFRTSKTGSKEARKNIIRAKLPVILCNSGGIYHSPERFGNKRLFSKQSIINHETATHKSK